MKPGDLSSNLGTALSAAAYATLGALIVRRVGNMMGWIMLGEGVALALTGLADIYAVLGVATFPGSLPAAKPVGALAQASFARPSPRWWSAPCGRRWNRRTFRSG